MRSSIRREQFESRYAHVPEGDADWRSLQVPAGDTFAWDDKSTYIRKPSFFDNLGPTPRPLTDIRGARVLVLVGDSVTTDHISPAGNIAKNSPAAHYLDVHGVPPREYNQYGARRGNHEVMVRGTFANIRLKNLMLPGVEGGYTRTSRTARRCRSTTPRSSTGRTTPAHRDRGRPYGTGCSRDWAAKGTMLLGVRAVIAKSFERIHRSNLIGMGVLPLQFEPGQDAAPRPHGRRGPRDRRHRRGHHPQEEADRPRGRQDVHGDRARRHAARGRVRQPRRHPAVRAAPARRPGLSLPRRPAPPPSPRPAALRCAASRRTCRTRGSTTGYPHARGVLPAPGYPLVYQCHSELAGDPPRARDIHWSTNVIPNSRETPRARDIQRSTVSGALSVAVSGPRD